MVLSETIATPKSHCQACHRGKQGQELQRRSHGGTLLAGSLAGVSTDLMYGQDHLPWDGLGQPPPGNSQHHPPPDTPTSHSDLGIAGGGFPRGLSLGCAMFTV